MLELALPADRAQTWGQSKNIEFPFFVVNLLLSVWCKRLDDNLRQLLDLEHTFKRLS
jgi:hypothetical protein